MFGSFSIVSIQKIRADQFLLTGSAFGEPYDPAKHPSIVKRRLKAKSISIKKQEKKYSCEFQLEKGS